MSSSASSTSSNNANAGSQQSGGGGGLQGSTPLVTLSTGPPGSSSIRPVQKLALSPAASGDDSHPLAVPYPLVSGNPPATTANVELSEQHRRAPAALGIPSLAGPLTFPATMPQRTTPPKPTVVALPPIKKESMIKPMDVQVDEFLAGPSARLEQGHAPILQPLVIPSKLPPLERLRALVQRRQWALVASESEGLLRGATSHYQPIYAALLREHSHSQNTAALPMLETQQQELVEILILYCQSLVLLKRNVELGVEVEQWSFLHQQEPPIAWIPWELHVTAAASLAYTNSSNVEKANKVLWDLRTRIMLMQEDDKTTSGGRLQCAVGLAHVEGALANLATRRKDWRMALKAQQRIMDNVLPVLASEASASDPSSGSKALETAHQCQLLSRQGRTLLQAGALPGARQVFEQIGALEKTIEGAFGSGESSPRVVRILPAQLAVDEGLLSFSYGKYEEALEFFRKGVQMLQSQRRWTIDFDEEEPKSIWSCLSVTSADMLRSEAVNNMALCALYTCRLPEALQLLEGLIREDPAAVMSDRVVSNMCTLYELGFDSNVAAGKKRMLLHIAHNRFGLYDIGVEHFRLQ